MRLSPLSSRISATISLHPAQPQPWDPGAARLIVKTPNIDAAMAALMRAGASMLTHSSAPVKTPEGRVALVRDPDGYLIELVEGSETAVSMGLAVSDIRGPPRILSRDVGL